MWYVYFLSLKNGHTYVGSTDDLRRRIRQHRSGEVKSTKGRQPATLVCYIAIHGSRAARRLERYFKSGSGKAFANRRLLRQP